MAAIVIKGRLGKLIPTTTLNTLTVAILVRSILQVTIIFAVRGTKGLGSSTILTILQHIIELKHLMRVGKYVWVKHLV